MHILLNNSSMVPVYEQLAGQIRQKILSGDLKEETALPSVRVLSAQLKISALTVKKAYDRLEEEGFVVTVHGKGTYVASANQMLALEARRKAVEEDFASCVAKAEAIGMTQEEILTIVHIMLEEAE